MRPRHLRLPGGLRCRARVRSSQAACRDNRRLRVIQRVFGALRPSSGRVVAAARDALKVTIAAETARAYADVCTLGEQIAVAEHNVSVVSREEQITQARHDAGANSDFDVVRAQALVAQVRATLPPLLGQRRAALFHLAVL